MKKKHQNSQKRIYVQDGVCFITTNTKNWFPFFEERIFCELFVEQLRLCKQLKEFKLYAWFLGYDHFHMLLQPGDEFNYSDVMFSVKKQFSHNVNVILGYNKPYTPSEGAQSIARLRGYDVGVVATAEQFNQYILNLRNQFIQKYQNGHPFPKFRWHKSFRDHIERNDKDFGIKWNYIKWNPVKHNMPNNWPYVFSNPKYADLIDEIEL